MKKKLLISIVSHKNGNLIKNLLSDLNSLIPLSRLEVQIILTLNLPESEDFILGYQNLSIDIIRNKKIKGFGANHNYAFKKGDSDYFCVINPDVRMVKNVFDELVSMFKNDIAVIGPRVISPSGSLEDSFRKFPTISSLIERKFTSYSIDYKFEKDSSFQVDWVAGMFMIFDSSLYKKINGFDEGYFMYLEDADICRQFRLKNLKTIYVSKFEVVHHARRASRKKIKYLFWHIRSLVRFILKGKIKFIKH